MATYQLLFRDTEGREAARGVVHCADDVTARTSASRLLMGKDQWKGVEVIHLQRQVARILREDLVDG